MLREICWRSSLHKNDFKNIAAVIFLGDFKILFQDYISTISGLTWNVFHLLNIYNEQTGTQLTE